MQDNTKPIRIMLTGGGTGGHIFPLVAVARALRAEGEQENRAVTFVFVGPKTEMAEDAFGKERISARYITAGKLRRYASWRTLLDIVKIPATLVQSLWHVYATMPDAIFSKGGYGSFFPVFAGWLYRIPIIVHESDTSMGLSNKISRMWAKRVILSFPTEQKTEKEEVLGNPVRDELFTTDPDAARRILGLTFDRPVVLIQGGSQGSRAINYLVERSLPTLIQYAEIIHQAGSTYTPKTRDAFYHPAPFLDEKNLAAAYAAASIIVSRAGSGNIFEIARAGKPSILIPLPSARGDHQRTNAYAYANEGAGVIIEEINLGPNLFAQQILALLRDTERQREMTEKARAFAKPAAARNIAKSILREIFS